MRQLIARIDDDLHERLRSRAEAEGRSMNGLITEILRSAVAPLDAREAVRSRLRRRSLQVVPPRRGPVPSRDAAIASTHGAGRAASAALAAERAAE